MKHQEETAVGWGDRGRGDFSPSNPAKDSIQGYRDTGLGQFVPREAWATPAPHFITAALSLFASIHLTWHHSIKSAHDKENNLGQE